MQVDRTSCGDIQYYSFTIEVDEVQDGMAYVHLRDGSGREEGTGGGGLSPKPTVCAVRTLPP